MNATQAVIEARRLWGPHAAAAEHELVEKLVGEEYLIPVCTVGVVGKGLTFEEAFRNAEKNGLLPYSEAVREVLAAVEIWHRTGTPDDAHELMAAWERLTKLRGA